MEAARSSETLVPKHHTTRRNDPENREFYLTALKTSNMESWALVWKPRLSCKLCGESNDKMKGRMNE